MLVLNKIQKDFLNIVENENFKVTDNKSLQNFQEKTEKELAKTKDTIYKIHQDQVHPLDKDLLENLK